MTIAAAWAEMTRWYQQFEDIPDNTAWGTCDRHIARAPYPGSVRVMAPPQAAGPPSEPARDTLPAASRREPHTP